MESTRKSRSVSHDHAYLSAAEDEEVIQEEVTIVTSTGNQTKEDIDCRSHVMNLMNYERVVDKSEGLPPTPIGTTTETYCNSIDNSEMIVGDGNEYAITSANSTHAQNNSTRGGDMVFGSYDELTNCITIFMPQGQQQNLDKKPITIKVEKKDTRRHKEDTITVTSEQSEEITPEEAMKSIAAPLEPCLSPLSSLSLMESGYQSLGSPDSDDLWSCGRSQNNDGLDDLWNDSFSELFPTLV